jgi:hypothetical protein
VEFDHGIDEVKHVVHRCPRPAMEVAGRFDRDHHTYARYTDASEDIISYIGYFPFPLL